MKLWKTVHPLDMLTVILVIILCGILLASCQTQKELDTVNAANAALEQELEHQNAINRDLKVKKAALDAKTIQIVPPVSDWKDAAVEAPSEAMLSTYSNSIKD